MSVLLEKIKQIDSNAAWTLKQASFCNDSDLLSLTRQDLSELFPGKNNLKLRKAIFDKIHQETHVDLLLREVKKFIPESFKAALDDNEALLGYLQMLKEIRNQVNNVQAFLDAHINLLEDLKKPKQELDWASASAGESLPRTSGSVTPKVDRTWSLKQKKKIVTYKMVISGKTLGAHQQILDRVKSLTTSLELQERGLDEQSDAILVFCPVVSRLGTDVEEALKQVKGDDPVILIVMHYSYEPRYAVSQKSWNSDVRTVLHVNVFYHDTMNGLLKCQENDNAISAIRNYLETVIGATVTENPLPVVPQKEPSYSTYADYGGHHQKTKTEKSSSGFFISSIFSRS